jgi:hypothetical protein
MDDKLAAAEKSLRCLRSSLRLSVRRWVRCLGRTDRAMQDRASCWLFQEVAPMSVKNLHSAKIWCECCCASRYGSGLDQAQCSCEGISRSTALRPSRSFLGLSQHPGNGHSGVRQLRYSPGHRQRADRCERPSVSNVSPGAKSICSVIR